MKNILDSDIGVLSCTFTVFYVASNLQVSYVSKNSVRVLSQLICPVTQTKKHANTHKQIANHVFGMFGSAVPPSLPRAI